MQRTRSISSGQAELPAVNEMRRRRKRQFYSCRDDDERIFTPRRIKGEGKDSNHTGATKMSCVSGNRPPSRRVCSVFWHHHHHHTAMPQIDSITTENGIQQHQPSHQLLPSPLSAEGNLLRTSSSKRGGGGSVVRPRKHTHTGHTPTMAFFSSLRLVMAKGKTIK